MPEDLLVQARKWTGLENLQWYSKCRHDALLSLAQTLGYAWGSQLPLVASGTHALLMPVLTLLCLGPEEALCNALVHSRACI